MKFNNKAVRAASARSGFLKVKVKGDRVMLYGKTVTVLEGDILA